MAKLLVMGASRGIGLETVKAAVAAGHAVRAMARSADRMRLTDPLLEPFKGDALDPHDVETALAGRDAVIQTLGVTPRPELLFRRVRLFSRATRLLVEKMEAAGIPRLVSVTGFGAGDSRNQGGMLYDTLFNLFVGRVYDDKNVQEYLIRNSDLDWVIARPVILTSGPPTGAYRVLLDPRDWRAGFISRADVADFLVKQVDDDTYLRRTPVLVG